ncbi:MAG TPA: hypothetical protein VI300_01335 [Solirubrobacter sp.]
MATANESRVHIVLVPGFGGFDALGQLEYYSGVTPLFRTWQAARTPGGRRAVLHYFDNLPTAGVRARADRLKRYLATRFARGEFLPDDTLALVGHSTGGLDIRRTVLDLARPGAAPIAVDGPHGASFTVDPADLVRMVKRLVFLSVPQRGTNIANWVQSYRVQREVVVAQLRASVLAAQVSLVEKVQSWLATRVASATGSDLLLAVQDALAEADERRWTLRDRTPERIAAAHEAAAELALWLRHIASDFSAIDDLACRQRAENSPSPAHASAEQRHDEVTLWKDHGIETRSYATIGRRPFAFAAGSQAPAWELFNPRTWPNLTEETAEAQQMDFVYRTCYRACAGGPFQISRPAAATALQGNRKQTVEVWDNDGIVNTASMLWPDGDRTILVDGDHGDIIGHYRLLPATPPSARKFHTYDLLRSVPEREADKFAHAFEQVWSGIFDFAVS